MSVNLELDLTDVDIIDTETNYIEHVRDQFNLFFDVLNTTHMQQKHTEILYKNVMIKKKIKNKFFICGTNIINKLIRKEVGKKDTYTRKKFTIDEVLGNSVSVLKWSNNIINEMINHNIVKDDIINLIKKLSQKFVNCPYNESMPVKYINYYEFNYTLRINPQCYKNFAKKYMITTYRGYMNNMKLHSVLNIIIILYKKKFIK